MSGPVRIQLSRRKGWRLPENTVKVDRTTQWGNPFIVNPHVTPGSRSGTSYNCVPTIEDAVACFEQMMLARPDYIASARSELSGKNLACWCKPGTPCHADVLLKLANEPRP